MEEISCSLNGSRGKLLIIVNLLSNLGLILSFNGSQDNMIKGEKIRMIKADVFMTF
jgi:hypothetical protein